MTPGIDIAAIAHALGEAVRDGKGWRCRCPVHGGARSNLSLKPGDAVPLMVKCWSRGCDPRDVLAALRHRGLLDDGRGGFGVTHRPEVQPVRSAKPLLAAGDNWRIIWREAVDLVDNPGAAYLAGRLGRRPARIADLRYHPRCPRGRDRLPALVALMRDAITNEPTGVHRTFVRPDGSGKADVRPAKMMLGAAAGAVVKLIPDESATMGLGLSEGIEDGLAIIRAGWSPVWACLSAGAMSSFPLLAGIEALTVFCDADSPGRRAAATVFAEAMTAATLSLLHSAAASRHTARAKSKAFNVSSCFQTVPVQCNHRPQGAT